MQKLQKFLLLIDQISTWVGKLFAWCVLLLTFVVAYEVFMRYVLSSPTRWAYDTSYILYGTLFMMAGAYALARNAHVRADVAMRYAPVRVQAGVDLTLYFLFFLPAILALIVAGFEFFRVSWVMGERSALSAAGPPLYPFKFVIPLTGFFLLLQGIAEIMRCVICLRTGEWPRRLDDVRETEEAIPIHKREEIMARSGSTHHE